MASYLSALLLLLMATAANSQTEVERRTRQFKPNPRFAGEVYYFRPQPPVNFTELGGPVTGPPEIRITRQRDTLTFAGVSTPARSKVSYVSGPVMPVVNVYFIWYGFFTPSAKAITRNFVKSLGFNNPRTPNVSTVSGWWDLVRPLGDSGKNFPAANPVVAGETDDLALSSGDGGKRGLTQTTLTTIVNSKILAGIFPLDKNGAYMVMTNDSVLVSGFCTQHCGYHSYFTSGTVRVKFAYVGHRACSGCSAPQKGPNNDSVSDAATSVFAHELAEIVTDPELNAWTNNTSGYENADACAWFYGTNSSFNGGVYNMVGKDGQKFLVQQMYDIATGLCLTSATAAPSATLNAVSTLYQNQYLLSPNGRFMAILQVDQNFVVYDGATAAGQAPIFSFFTQFSGAYNGTMNADGTFTLSNRTSPVYGTASLNSGGIKITMQNDGNLVIANSTGQGVWTSGTNSLDSGNGMAAGLFILQPSYFVSPAYRYKLALQADGNLVLYDGAQAKKLWASNTTGSGAKYLLYGTDGNLGLYAEVSPLSTAIWQSNTAGQIPGRLEIQDSGNVVLYNAANAIYWATNTTQTV